MKVKETNIELQKIKNIMEFWGTYCNGYVLFVFIKCHEEKK
jgi:hypothetical protein